MSLSGISRKCISGHRLYMSTTVVHSCSLFKLNYHKIIRALDLFVVPDLAALRTPAIEVHGIHVRFRMTGTQDLHYAANSKFAIYDVRKNILKVLLAVSGCCPNALIFLRTVWQRSPVLLSRRRQELLAR